MTKLPSTESDALVLAQDLIEFIRKNSALSRASPESLEQIQATVDKVKLAKETAAKAQLELNMALNNKREALQVLMEQMRNFLQSAQKSASGAQQNSLKLLSKRADAATHPLPSAPVGLNITAQASGSVTLAWKAALGGGRPAAYDVLRRESNVGSWICVATSVDFSSILTEQPRNVPLQYQVVAFNAAGRSEPSNTVATTV